MKKNRIWMVSAAVWLCLAAISTAEPVGWVITTDFATLGSIRSFEGQDPWTASTDLADIPGDAVGRYHEGLVYIVGRGSWNLIQVYDPGSGFALLQEFSLGTGLNLQDIAFDENGTAYVSCYDQAVLLKVDIPSESIVETINTAGFADADGLPETAWLHHRDGRLYVGCQRLDRNNWYTPSGPGLVLVLDMDTDSWIDMDPVADGIQGITLQGQNPYTRFQIDHLGRLLVGCSGLFGVADGGIEAIDLDLGQSVEIVLSEAEAGGDINQFQEDSGTVWAVMNDAAFNTGVVRSDSVGVTTLDMGTGFVHADLLLAGDYLFLADRTIGGAGIRVLDPWTAEEYTAAPVATGLPPAFFIRRQDEAAPVPGMVSGVAWEMSPSYPNPCNPSSRVRLQAKPGAVFRIRVLDVRGAVMNTGTVTAGPDGGAEYRFNGRDRRERTLAAGVYRIVADHGGLVQTRTVTLLK